MIQTLKQKKLKIRKNEELDNAVSRMWEVRTKIMSVIIGDLGTIKKGLDHKFQLLPGQPSAMELPKITLMRTANIIPKVLL